MATKRFCDRCEVEIPTGQEMHRLETDTSLLMELCHDCMDVLKMQLIDFKHFQP